MNVKEIPLGTARSNLTTIMEGQSEMKSEIWLIYEGRESQKITGKWIQLIH